MVNKTNVLFFYYKTKVCVYSLHKFDKNQIPFTVQKSTHRLQQL